MTEIINPTPEAVALSRHRGPFKFQVCRERLPTKSKPLGYVAETLNGTVAASDVIDEAMAILTDPRDTITAVYVWSDFEQQHVFTLTCGWADAQRARDAA